MKIVWTRRSIRNLDDISDYIASRSPKGADRPLREMRERVSILASFPEAGRPGRAPDTRELVIQGTTYIVVYRATPTMVSVLAVVHTSRRWPSTF